MGSPATAPERTDHLDLLRLLSGTQARRASLIQPIRAALARADLDRLALDLADRRVLPLIGGRAIEIAPDLCPDGFRSAVAAAHAAARARGLAIDAETRRVVDELARHDISALPLKGPLLADAAHGDIGLRESGDIDLLVARERIGKAARILEADGLGRPVDPIRRNGLPDLHLSFRPPGRPAVELHWRVHWYEEEFSAELLARARPAPDGLLRAAPADLAVCLLLFYARDGFHGVRLAADIAGWWDRNGAALPPRPLEDIARRHRGIARSLTAAATAVDQLTGVPARAWLGDAAARGRSVQMAVRLADWTQAGDRDQMAANISLADALLAPHGALPDFARRELVPRTGPTGTHAAKMLIRYGVALWHLRGGRHPQRPETLDLR